MFQTFMDGALFMLFPALYLVISGITYGIQWSFLTNFVCNGLIFEFKRFARRKWDMKGASETKKKLVLFLLPALVIIAVQVFVILLVVNQTYYFYNSITFHTLVACAVIWIGWDMFFMPLFFVLYKRKCEKKS